MQEKGAEERNKSEHAYPLPKGSVVTDRYYEPFIHVHIDKFPVMPDPRGIASMTLPTDPDAIQIGAGDQRIKLGPQDVVTGVPEKITVHGADPMTFTLRDGNGGSQEVDGVPGRNLFEVALAIERKESIAVHGDGSISKR